MNDRPLRLDILTRVSRTMGREGDSYGSPDIQLRDCRNWIALNQHLEGEHFHEENVSRGALVANRPGLGAVIERMRRGESDGVVVRAYDRFMQTAAALAGRYRRHGRGPEGAATRVLDHAARDL